VAGSDSAGLAGLEIDLKTIALFGVPCRGIATAATRQEATSYSGTQAREAGEFSAELDQALAENPKVVKTGMLANAELAACLCQKLEALPAGRRPALVVDPVLSSTSGGRLLDEEGTGVLIDRLLPLADVLTPNAVEAARLCSEALPLDREQWIRLGGALLAAGAQAVYLKAGHLPGDILADIFLDGQGEMPLPETPRRQGGPFRGTGCTLASALAAGLAQGLAPRNAAKQAQLFTAAAIARSARYSNYSVLGHEAAARDIFK
jgi:hydroxymethylpyrimidine/phosphomethylpyrimidine kinase